MMDVLLQVETLLLFLYLAACDGGIFFASLTLSLSLLQQLFDWP